MGNRRDHRKLMKTGLGVLLLWTLLQTGTDAQSCPGNQLARIDENNAVGALVFTIPVADSVTLQLGTPNVPFRLEGKNLVATEQLDYEKQTGYNLDMVCTAVPGGQQEPFTITVRVNNLNDNPPKFVNAPYTVNFEEMTAVGTVVGTFPATDPDGDMFPLSYTLTDPSGSFRLKNEFTPEIIVNKLLQYDDGNLQLTLTAQDDIGPVIPGQTDTATINIIVIDVDNRPPWFQPCSPVTAEGVKICPNTGYKGTVKLGVLETKPLPLTPNNIRAIDGDSGINEPIRYSIISGDEGLFQIGLETGDVTLLKPVDVTKTVTMTVMAFQARSSYQFATTSLTMEVVIASDNLPQFEKTQYEAVVEGVGSMAVEAADKNKAVKILATDLDYAAAGGINPNIVYSITGNPDFTVIGGFLFMVNDVAAGTYNMEVKAIDSSNSEEAVPAALIVEVLEEPTTTAPPTTVTTPTPEPTTGITTDPTSGSTGNTSPQSPNTSPQSPEPSTPEPSTSPQSPNPNTSPQSPDPNTSPQSPDPNTSPQSPEPNTSPETSNPTTKPDPSSPNTDSPTADTPTTVPSSKPTTTPKPIPTTDGGVIKPSGGFTSADMAALGATLGVLLFICIVVIAVLAVKIRKGNSDWKKINEASAFRSSLGPAGQKQGVQFTNEAFQHDDDDKDDKGGGLGNRAVLSGVETDKPQTRSLPRPPSPIPEEEKKVKPILARDKSGEDGYKAVWFKEDIDPNAKEEVVTYQRDREEEDDDDEDSDDENKIPKVKFSETDGDSGLGDKEDSDEEKAMTSSL